MSVSWSGFSSRAVACAAAAIAILGLTATAASAEFSVEPGSFKFSLTAPDGTPQRQAGAHPDLTTTFSIPLDGEGAPDGRMRNVAVDLPPGLVGSAVATPKCNLASVSTVDPGVVPLCPLASAVGEAWGLVSFPPAQTYFYGLVYAIEPYRDGLASFAFNLVAPVRLDVSLRSESDYGLTASVTNLTELAPVSRASVTFWGVPSDHNGPGPLTEPVTERPYGGPGGGAPIAQITNPTACGGALMARLSLTQWDGPLTPSAEAAAGSLSGCDKLRFDPSIRVKPTISQAGQPSGYAIDIDVPQNDDPHGLATPTLEDATVTFPKGVTLSPSVAHGLGACTDAQVGLHDDDAPGCPNSAKIGNLSITSPLLEGDIDGDVFVGQPLPGNRYRVFFSTHDPRLKIKLEGRVALDPVTGQVSTTFLDNPPLPFSNLHVELKGGPNAALVNPKRLRYSHCDCDPHSLGRAGGQRQLPVHDRRRLR